MFTNNPEWVPPDELPDLSSAKEIAIDLETRDPNLKNKGPGWPTKDGEVIGYAVATSFWSGYLPVKHLGGGNHANINHEKAQHTFKYINKKWVNSRHALLVGNPAYKKCSHQ